MEDYNEYTPLSCPASFFRRELICRTLDAHANTKEECGIKVRDWYRYRPTETAALRAEALEYARSFLSGTTTTEQYDVYEFSSEISGDSKDGKPGFRHYGIVLHDELIHLEFRHACLPNRESTVVGVKVRRNCIREYEYEAKTWTHIHIGKTTYSPDMVSFVASYMITAFGSYHKIWHNCATFAKLLLDVICPGKSGPFLYNINPKQLVQDRLWRILTCRS